MTTFAFLLGVLGPVALNHFPLLGRLWTKEKQGVNAIRDYGGPLEQLLLRALNEGKYVRVTLNNGKVYIGRVTVGLNPEDDRGSVKDFV